MHNFVDIYKAEKHDAAHLAIIGACVWIDTYSIYGVDEIIADYIKEHFTTRELEELIEHRSVYVIKTTSSAIGYVVVTEEKDKSEIENFYILPKFQGGGLGRKMLMHLRKRHKNLWLRCWYKNERALRFYYANGFTKTGETYFHLGGESHKNEILSSIS